MAFVIAGAAVLIVLRILWWWFIGRNRPKYPPIVIDDNDPAMLQAIETARQSLVRFRQLFDQGIKDTQVKVAFITSSGVRENLWAEVLEFGETMVKVRYLTPPVSHSGKLERVHEHSIGDIRDWVAITDEGLIHGGYTQRVMFERGRELWGRLPRELEEQSSRYVS